MARILVVDDDEAVRAIISTVLRRDGHEVLQAEDGVRGLECARYEALDAVVTDIVMPEQDGVGLIVALRRECPRVPIIAMSGGTERSMPYLQMAQRLGARAVLHKPFRIEELRQALVGIGVEPPPTDRP